jgi:hypothetical protein
LLVSGGRTASLGFEFEQEAGRDVDGKVVVVVVVVVVVMGRKEEGEEGRAVA